MNYKIRVTPETSKEVQELFFALGGKWTTFGSNVKHVHGDLKLSKIYFSNGVISGGWSERNFENGFEQEVTLPQLRDLVHGEKVDYTYHVGKDVIYEGGDACLAIVDNNDFVGIFTKDKKYLKVKSSEISLKPKEYECYKIRVDETTKNEAINLLNKIREDRGFYKEAPKNEDDDTKLYLHNNSILSGKSGKPFDEEYFDKFDGREVTLSELYNIAHGNKEMTWQDAEQAIKDGKDVQVFVCEWSDISDVFKNHKFRIAPQRITLHNSYTKEELLKIAGGME